jgi:hypothetical protein
MAAVSGITPTIASPISPRTISGFDFAKEAVGGLQAMSSALQSGNLAAAQQAHGSLASFLASPIQGYTRRR